MCGRYALIVSGAELAELLRAARWSPWTARYNIAPTQLAPILRLGEDDQRELVPARWGLIPSWAKDPAIGNRMINARIETAAQKPSFRRAWAKRRCMLPADGYYEWYAGQGVPKQPFYIHRSDGASLAMAGLFEFWKDGEDWLVSTAILTTSAPDALGQIHDRMPLLVPRENWAKWLDPQGPPADDIVVPAMATGLEAYPVSTEVNNVKHNGPQLLEPLPAS